MFLRGSILLTDRKPIANVTILLQYPSTVSSDFLPERDDLNCANVPGTLPPNADISPAARDLLKRLLQPEPRLRLRNLLSLQRIAFYMGYDIQSYMLKKVINTMIRIIILLFLIIKADNI